MTAIWAKAGADGQWEELQPAGFTAEKDLHQMVFRSIGMLPLAGAPVVASLAKEVEVPATKGRIDIVGVEASGIPVLVEVKLKANQEARKAVVAQLLSYAASLRGSSIESFSTRLANAGMTAPTVSQAVTDVPIEEPEFNATLAASLAEGRFRLVLVLDEAPSELVRLVGYLEAISNGFLSIDLITVSTFTVGGKTVAVPQRVDAQHMDLLVESAAPTATPVVSEPGAGLFVADAALAPGQHQEALARMAEWAQGLVAEGVAVLVSRQGSTKTVLTPRLKDEDVGLCSLWNYSGQPQLWLHGTVLSRRAPAAWRSLGEQLGKEVGFRAALSWAHVTPQLLAVLADGYREASSIPSTA